MDCRKKGESDTRQSGTKRCRRKTRLFPDSPGCEQTIQYLNKKLGELSSHDPNQKDLDILCCNRGFFGVFRTFLPLLDTPALIFLFQTLKVQHVSEFSTEGVSPAQQN